MAAPCDGLVTITGEQRALTEKLAFLAEMIEGYEATVFMRERGRLWLQTELRMTGYQAPAPEEWE